VQYRQLGGQWIPARLAMLAMGETVAVGMMCCTPERAGLDVTFRDFIVAPPISRDLHG
jgi:regulation of enolase protein 1 (concanavalin A-like superfamily)